MLIEDTNQKKSHCSIFKDNLQNKTYQMRVKHRFDYPIFLIIKFLKISKFSSLNFSLSSQFTNEYNMHHNIAIKIPEQSKRVPISHDLLII